MSRFATVVAVLLALAPFTGRAQDAAPQLPEDPRAPRFRELERGVFIGFEVGWMGLFDTQVSDPEKFPFASAGGGTAGGFAVGIDAGVDLGSRVAVSAFVLGTNQSADVSYGAFDVFSAGGDLRVAFLGFRASDDLERLRLYLHGRAGWMRTHPDGLFGSSDLLFAGGPGVEYYTRLRHFSVALGADATYVLDAATLGYAGTFTVRYSF